MLTNKIIGFIGGGNMAEALIRGLQAGGVPAAKILVSEPVAERRTFLCGQYGISATDTNQALAAAGDVIVLAVKPQVAAAVLADIAPALKPGTLLISIMAGVTTSAMEAHFNQPVKVVRVMPNTPALVLSGASALCGGSHATGEDLTRARCIFELVGTAYVVDEKLLDAVTGLSGSGPAYVLTIIEALSDAGVKNGLPRDVATGLAAQTLFGTARLLLETGEHPAVLREKVTSPGGTTIAGLQVLEQQALRGALMDAVDAATARSRVLGT